MYGDQFGEFLCRCCGLKSYAFEVGGGRAIFESNIKWESEQKRFLACL